MQYNHCIARWRLGSHRISHRWGRGPAVGVFSGPSHVCVITIKTCQWQADDQLLIAAAHSTNEADFGERQQEAAAATSKGPPQLQYRTRRSSVARRCQNKGTNPAPQSDVPSYLTQFSSSITTDGRGVTDGCSPMAQRTIVVAQKWHDENRKGSGAPRSSRHTKHTWSGLVKTNSW